MGFSRRKLLKTTIASIVLLQLRQIAAAKTAKTEGLKDVFKNDFFVGTAISSSTLAHNDEVLLGLIAREFNAITAENAMKWSSLNPYGNEWNWSIADKFVEFGQQHKMYTVGHNLIWHGQVPEAVFKNEKGGIVSPDQLLTRMQSHITRLVDRYKGKVAAWDVVNEAVEDGKGWRKSQWFTILGENYLAKAFQFAHEADPKAHLMYNDYNMFLPAKRDFVVEMLKAFKKQGVPIHGVGMQCHLGIDTPDLIEVEKSIVAFAEQGVRVHITELDVDVLPTAWAINGAEISTRYEYKPELDPYIKGLSSEMEETLSRRYEAIYRLFLKHRDKITRVTTWGTSDDASWLNGFPIEGRINYPLLFDRQHHPKLAYQRVAALGKK